MRTGQYQRPNTEARQGSQTAQKNAETLFETRTVAEIREVETRTRKEIEEKKEELRQLVGGSYRDLIESADKIFDMQESCKAIMNFTSGMAEGFDELHARVADLETVSTGPSETCGRKKLYAIGSRVKYLVDTPEIIWSCLDEHAYLTGAERYLRAWEVHRLLTDTTDAEHNELLASFPLLHHHWPQVETFQDQILNRSRDRLTEAHLGVEACAIALASIGMINEIPSKQVLTLFLDARLSCIRQLVQSSSNLNDQEVEGSFATILRQLIVILQRTVCEAGQLFMESMPGHLALFFSTMSVENEDDRLFGGIPAPEAEIGAWDDRRGRLSKVVAPLISEDVAEACQTWLKKVAQEVKEQGTLLLKEIKSMPALIKLEATMHEEIAAEEGCADSMEWITAALATAPAAGRAWESTCRVVLGEQVNIWHTLFDAIFLDRAEALVDDAFNSLKLLTATEEALNNIQVSNQNKENIMCNLRTVDEAGWSNDFHHRPTTATMSRSEDSHAVLAQYSPEVGNISRELDEQLGRILEDVVQMRDSPANTEDCNNRAALLEPHTQEQCHRIMLELAGGLDVLLTDTLDKAKSTTKSANAPPSDEAVEKALFIGRIAVALSSHSAQIPVTLGSPTKWASGARDGRHEESEKKSWAYRKGAKGLRGGDKAASAAGGAGAHLKKVKEAFNRVSYAAYSVWVEIAASKLRSSLQSELLGDPTLKITAPHRGWEETVISAGDGEATDGDADGFEMKLSLPAVPSPYVIAYIFSACREIHRIGSHTLEVGILRQFADQMALDVLDVYGALVDVFTPEDLRPPIPASEKGVLQLLFDVRFLLDVLCGASGTAISRTDELKVRATELEDALQSNLDPIDWATYEPYLWSNEQRYYQRCAVLFGALVQLRRLHVGTPGKLAASSETNTLNVVPTVPRFGYLPITTPSTTSKADTAGANKNKFANGGFKTNGGVAQDPVLKNESSAPLLKGLGFMGSVGNKFGLNMLSDSKLKDKSAAALSSFGDMLAGTGPLTSWGKRE